MSKSKTIDEPQIKNEIPIPLKVIVVGDSGVGKTSIVGRYTDKYAEKSKPTIAASFSSRTEIIDNYQISFNIWDTAGTERYRSVNQIFYKQAYICLLVYDITKKESFESLRTYWSGVVKENSTKGIIFGLAGNKVDLMENEEVEKNEVEEFAKEIEAEFRLTSALNNVAIDDLFESLGKRFIQTDTFKEMFKKFDIDLNNNNKGNNNSGDKNMSAIQAGRRGSRVKLRRMSNTNIKGINAVNSNKKKCC